MDSIPKKKDTYYHVCKNRIIPLLYARNTRQYQKQPLPQSKVWKKRFKANGVKKELGTDILTATKINFKPNLLKRNKERHSILIK